MTTTPEQIRELYPDFAKECDNSDYACGTADYGPLIESFGDVLLRVDDSDYQGDTRVILRHNGLYGLLIFGWGSCSGCDALQACNTIDELVALRDDLHSRIRWGTAKELLDYVNTHDWMGDYCWHQEETKRFIEEAKTTLEKNVCP